jgi:hypothetical protein
MELSPSLVKKAEALCRKFESYGSATVNIYPWLHRLGLEYISMLLYNVRSSWKKYPTNPPV